MPSGPIMIIAGSNRPGANALRISQLLAADYAAANTPAEIYSLADLPPEIFLPTAYAAKPEPFVLVQQRVLAARGLHVITPEYNGSFPGVLKHFIDMLKFPESFDRKPVAFTGVAAGMWGGLRAVEQLQHVFGYRNAHVYPDRVFIAGAGKKFDQDGNFVDDSIRQRLAQQAGGFAEFVRRFGHDK